jgi:hypothetical protein
MEVGSLIALAAVAFAGFVTAGVILRQADLLIKQNNMRALLGLQTQWESPRLRSLRSRWAEDPRDVFTAMPILEFLEDLAAFHKREATEDAVLWDTPIGRYAARYYFYNRQNGTIDTLRHEWRDSTLFDKLESVLWPSYLRFELSRRGVGERTLLAELEESEPRFIETEAKALTT